MDLRGLAATEEGAVVLPSLKSAGDNMRCCWGWPVAAIEILRDLVPVSENAVATLLPLRRRIMRSNADALAEDRQPGRLADRLSMIRRPVEPPGRGPGAVSDPGPEPRSHPPL